MSTITLTKENFEENINHNGITIVDYWAEWCGPCRMFGPIFEAAATRHPEIRFGKVDTDKEQELAAHSNIRSIPTVEIYKNGVKIYSKPGAMSGNDLDNLLNEAKNHTVEKPTKWGKEFGTDFE